MKTALQGGQESLKGAKAAGTDALGLPSVVLTGPLFGDTPPGTSGNALEV